jgi:hypothetical protein
MTRWWLNDGPAPAVINDPRPLAPVAETFEQLFLMQPELTKELLDALAGCNEDLRTLFGPSTPAAAAGCGEI